MSLPQGNDTVDFRPSISIISDQVEVPPLKLDNREEDVTSIASEDIERNEPRRIILLNSPQTSKFCSNKVSTAKYNLLTFFPIFLFEQFRKYSNIFFLFMALLQQIPDVSPTGRYTTLVPLLFILTVSATKEVVEDYKRHRADRETNHRKVEVLRRGSWVTVRWTEVVVGDIVKVLENQFLPADMVLLSSRLYTLVGVLSTKNAICFVILATAEIDDDLPLLNLTTSISNQINFDKDLVIDFLEPQSICFIETANLDGETNLKIRQGLKMTSQLMEMSELADLRGSLHCELPNRLLYDFKGVLRLENTDPAPLGPDQLLLRGAQLRNTTWAYGVVIYTGRETKLMKNATRVPLKRSSVDKMANTQILMLFALLIGLCLVAAIMSEIWTEFHLEKDWYIGLDELEHANFGFNLLTFIILFNNLIPISLQVSIEVVRIAQASFINLDEDMYHAESDTPAMARTSNLNEELGMIKYVFSDKTGTLTRNVMEFKKCSIADVVYDCEDVKLVDDYRSMGEMHDYIEEFMELLTVCHTVIPERKSGILTYQAASPDERALVNGAKAFGWIFTNRTPDTVEVEVLGEIKTFKLLHVLEFTSTRKRMSVIVEDPKGVLKLFCKGADTVIYERLAPKKNRFREITLKNLEEFATEGLRTLCCAYSVIQRETYEEWKLVYQKAAISLRHREAKLEEAANLIEVDLILLGATAIEDKLQDQVPETIETLIKAGIKVWVLTGDKQETAINIGHSCRLITSEMSLILLNEESLDATRETILKRNQELGNMLRQPNELALVVDGTTLTYALCCDVKRDFLDLCISCKVVICCRVSPSQKADVVELVSKMTKSVTLAIGDGANDVAMIQKAHVGVGISGVEGLQAACASDYSIAQFRFLLKLLLVHGAWNYDRMCKLILYSFYKNICLYIVELWFAFYSGWSGQIMFDRWSIGMYNVAFTAAPPLALGLFDKVCSAEARLIYPKLYKPSQSAQYFNFKVFWLWIGNAVMHSIILFWFPLCTVYYDVVWPQGRTGDYLFVGNIIYTYVVITVCLKAGLTTSSWTWLSYLAIFGSIGLWFAFLNLWSNMWPTLDIAARMLGQDVLVLTSFGFWLGMFVSIVAPLMIDVAVITFRKTFNKTYTDQILEGEIKKKDATQIVPADSSHTLIETARLLRSVKCAFTRRGTTVTELELSHGFAFSQEEGGAMTQSQMIRAYDTTLPRRTGT